ncbi:cutinase family protein [Antrihabitans sp. YC2-6]|uniref:cutinase family protein n=1 Tax=Antrihabitans sp. YC2-6 TaxID=2799498 RepID=UPI0018F723EB|nr:cutinase family protein [Antrihabitans sp. YC2-6]MBJ8346402.1 cutinase family protein [Antrihabitans sp. YC2-6]
MTARVLVPFVGAAIAAFAMPLTLSVQTASAAPCPDVEVVFARGTAEPPGLGITGTAFVESLRLQTPGRSVGAYAVNYEASADFGNPIPLARTVVDGVRDSQAHVEYMASACPGTKIVLGGYSQGAVVAGFTTMAGVPDGVRPEYASSLPAPMPPEVASHVSAVVLFGKPSDRWMRDVEAPPVVVGPLYGGKVADYCVGGDTICDGSPVGQPNALHVFYSFNGMAFNGASFAAGRL